MLAFLSYQPPHRHDNPWPYVISVRGERHAIGSVQAVHTAHSVLQYSSEGQRSRARVSLIPTDRVVSSPRCIRVISVNGERLAIGSNPRSRPTAHPALPILLRRSTLPCSRFAHTNSHIVIRPRGVRVLAVRRERHAMGLSKPSPRPLRPSILLRSSTLPCSRFAHTNSPHRQRPRGVRVLAVRRERHAWAYPSRPPSPRPSILLRSPLPCSRSFIQLTASSDDR